MSDTHPIHKLYINVHGAGIGEKSNSKGHIGLQRTTHNGGTSIDLSIGRGKYYGKPALVMAISRMSISEAHELAGALNHLVGAPSTCPGEGIKTFDHKRNATISLTLEVDLCTILQNKEQIKEQVLARISKQLDQDLKIPEIKEPVSD